MAANENGATTSMLSDIGMSRASDLVMGVRYTTSPPGPTFIPELDNLLLSARSHPGGSSLRRGDLIEVSGPSGSGKTTLAVFILMTTLLPATLELPLATTLSVPLGGRAARAAFLSPPSHAPVTASLEQSMRGHIASRIDTLLREGDIPVQELQRPEVSRAIKEAIDQSLDRLLLLRPKPSALHWLQAITHLLSLKSNPEVVICDGFGDGHWAEREDRRADVSRRLSGKASMQDVWDALVALRSECGSIVIVTLQAPPSTTPHRATHLPKPYPAPYTRPEEAPWPLNVQLALNGSSRPLQFPAETTLVEALRGQVRSDTQVCTANVRVPGGRGLVGTPAGAPWTFGIGEDGFVPFT